MSTNYLQWHHNGKLDPEEFLLAGFLGDGNWTGFTLKELERGKVRVGRDDFLAGGIQAMRCAMRQLGIEYSHCDYPEPLRPFLHRRVWTDRLGRLMDRVDREELDSPVFVKPKEKLKRFTGFVLGGREDFYRSNWAGRGTEVWCSDPVRFVSEFRCPVIGGDVCGAYLYDAEGPFHREPDMGAVREMAAAWDGPKGYCLDVGVLDDGRTALVEVNDGFSVGCYGMPAETYWKMLSLRWEELKLGCK